MAKATITLAKGTKVVVEGSPAEIKQILDRLENDSPSVSKVPTSRDSKKKSIKRSQAISDYVIELRDAGLFKKPQSLSDIRTALAAEGHLVPITTLSGRVLEVVKKRQLRRVKDGKIWKYVNR